MRGPGNGDRSPGSEYRQIDHVRQGGGNSGGI
jgi:hypothetical protein